MELSRNGVRSWLLKVLSDTGDTATSLARKAGIAQSTLTRFLNDDNGPMLTLRTVSKIAHVAGSAPAGFQAPLPDLAPGGLAEGEALPLTDSDGLDVDPEVRAALDALTHGQDAADVWRLRTHALLHAGFRPGDLVVVNLGITPQSGDVVCAQHYQWASASAETIFRIYEPPFLVAACDDQAMRRPLVVDGERVIIKGVVTHLVRAR